MLYKEGVEHSDPDLLNEIRIGYQALMKSRKGEMITTREKEVLNRLLPIDVTYILLREIDTLNHKLISIIEENARLQDKIKAYSGPIDIDKP